MGSEMCIRDRLLTSSYFAIGMSPYTAVQDTLTGNYLFVVDGMVTFDDADVYDFSA